MNSRYKPPGLLRDFWYGCALVCLAVVTVAAVILLSGCASSFAWEDPSTSTHAERVQDAWNNEKAFEVQIAHQRADGSISDADYNKMLNEARAYARQTQ